MEPWCLLQLIEGQSYCEQCMSVSGVKTSNSYLTSACALNINVHTIPPIIDEMIFSSKRTAVACHCNIGQCRLTVHRLNVKG